MKIVAVKTTPEINNVLDGDYCGVMGGWVVDVKIGEEKYEINTNYGIRTFNYPCVVYVRGGKILEIGVGIHTPPAQLTSQIDAPEQETK